jgi:invasion protein IalB
LGSEAIEAFRAGNEAVVRMVALNGDAIAITVSLSGFSAAWTRLHAF